jgi:hypothetical protein
VIRLLAALAALCVGLLDSIRRFLRVEPGHRIKRRGKVTHRRGAAASMARFTRGKR